MSQTSAAFLLRFLFICALCLAVRVQAQSPRTLDAFTRGPYTGPIEEALVGLEVTNTASDGKTKLTRRGNGFVLRCDGFILGPAGLFSLTMTSQDAKAARQSVTVYLHPGTDQEKRIEGRPPHYVARNLGYVAFKLDDFHLPAAKTLLPDTLAAGDEIQVIYSRWDEGRQRFAAPERLAAKLAPPPKETTKQPPGTLLFAESVDSLPAGAVVVGPEGMAIGQVPGASASARHEGFVSFSVLDLATNCVTPVPTPDSRFVASESGPMVAVPGGPLILPAEVSRQQPDMEGASVACVAPFQIDKYEVTNAQYLAFWQGLSEKERADRSVVQALYPLSWADTDPPFPPELANVPVLGVPLQGAMAYARSRGKRLPTPYEWCLAAFGPKGETETSEWVKRYMADRQQTWQRIVLAHRDYMAAHPDISWENTHTLWSRSIPWTVFYPPELPAAAFSKQVVEAETAHLWSEWNDPPYVLPVGSRAFDAGPYGAMDMVLNASELVMPLYGRLRPTGSLAMHVLFRFRSQGPPPSIFDLGGPEGFWITSMQAPPLSRVLRRSFLGPSREDLVILSAVSEAGYLLAPINELRVEMVGTGRIFGKRLVTVGMTAGTTSSLISPSLGVDLVPVPDRANAGYRLWQFLPRHLHREMGREVPLDVTDPPIDIPAFGANGPHTAPPVLDYLSPVGFRCVR